MSVPKISGYIGDALQEKLIVCFTFTHEKPITCFDDTIRRRILVESRIYES